MKSRDYELNNQKKLSNRILTLVFAVISVIYVLPVLVVLMNSFKFNEFVNSTTFEIPNAISFAGFNNYIKGITFGNYPFYNSVFYSFTIT